MNTYSDDPVDGKTAYGVGVAAGPPDCQPFDLTESSSIAAIRSSCMGTNFEIGVIEQTWKEILGVPGRVARDDEFFELGGDSVTALRVAATLSKLLDVKVSVRLVLTFTVASELADKLVALRKKNDMFGNSLSEKS
jgi:acyl carrier protein